MQTTDIQPDVKTYLLLAGRSFVKTSLLTFVKSHSKKLNLLINVKNIKSLIWVIGGLLMLSSCGGGKDFVYLRGIQDTAKIDSIFTKPLVIHPGDQLSISLSSLNSEADAVINQSNAGASIVAGTSGTNVSGYFVSENGTINLPRLGKLKVEGMTHETLKDTLQLMFEPYTKNPIVNVRLMNYTITVLGEVAIPGQLRISTPQIDILQAIGMAGDITAYGKKNNVLLIRKEGSNRIVRHLDLTNPSIFNSPFFQLEPGDFIYVEPNITKKNSTSLTFQLWPLITGTMTLLVVITNSFLR